MNNLVILLLILSAAFYPQKKDPEAILERVKENFNRVNDYQVDVNVKVEVEFIKVPDMKAILYFKQPDKMQLDSEGFAMLPKGGMNFSPASLLTGNYTSFYEKDTIKEGVETSVIKIIPLGDGGDVVLSTLWIDSKHHRITKVETTTKTQGTYQIELKYQGDIKFPLPSAMNFSFNIEKMNLPKGMGGDINTQLGKKDEAKTTTGKVFITYSGYKINRGISDSVFKEPKK